MKNVEDIFPLSPMQSAMLLHARHAVQDTLFSQFCFELAGVLDPTVMADAWADTVRRHPSLRTMFAWQGLQHPVQIVRQVADLEVQTLDWSGDDAPSQDGALERWLAADRARGFDLTKAPLMRVAIVLRGPRLPLLIWSSHHLVLDRWCIGTILTDLLTFYRKRGATGQAGDGIRRAPGFREYVAWLQVQDVDAARSYWRDALRGVAGASRAAAAAPTRAVGDDDGPGAVDEGRMAVPAPVVDALRARARELRITMGVLVQAAWALVLHGLRSHADIVFGTTVSGRPTDLLGVESIVGTFINNVPVRVRFAAEVAAGDWLQAIHREQQLRTRHEFLPTTEIHTLSGLAAGEPLFDALLVSLAGTATVADEQLTLRPLDGRLTSAFPITLGIEDTGDALSLQLAIETRRGSHPLAGLGAASVLERLVAGLRACAGDPTRRLGELEGFVRGVAPNEDAIAAAAPSPPASRSAGAVAIKGREGEELEILEGVLLAECRRLLARDDLSLADGFFEAGGDSLTAARLHVTMETMVGRAVPQLALFEAKTIGGMAKLLAEGDWPLVAGLVRPLQPQGDRTPLFCISSPEVNSMGYVLLARHLDSAMPVHLVQSPPRTDRVLRMAPSEIPDLARDYVRAVLEVQPAGTYRLLGMCGGGMLAFEMARILQAAGHRVDFVGILNTFALHTLSNLYYLRRAERRLRYYGRRLRGMFNLGSGERLGELRRLVRRKLQPSSRTIIGVDGSATSDVAQVDAPQPAPDEPTLQSVTDEWLSVDWPDRAPPAPTYSGTVTVFRTRKQMYFRIRDRGLGWGLHAASVQLRYLTAVDHLDVLREPNVAATARVISESLDELDAVREQPGC